jgi:hypothetical protein
MNNRVLNGQFKNYEEEKIDEHSNENDSSFTSSSSSS